MEKRSKYLEKIAEKHTDWPRVVLLRVLHLAVKKSRGSSLAPDEAEEYDALYGWCVRTLSAGVAFKQESLLEH